MANLFRKHYAYLERTPTTLPFTVGGAIQHGKQPEEKNCQDAMAIIANEKGILAVVADGCGGSSFGENAFSVNEVGANLSCLITANLGRRIIRSGLALDKPDVFLDRFSIQYLAALDKILAATATAYHDRRYVFYELLTTTLLCVILTREHYIVFTAGDGIFGLNGVINNLEAQEGIYPSQKLINRSRRHRTTHVFNQVFIIRAAGNTDDLENVILATDGCKDIYELPENPLLELVTNINRHVEPGYDPGFFLEFRKRVSMPFEADQNNLPLTRLHDDRTIIVLRRIVSLNDVPT